MRRQHAKLHKALPWHFQTNPFEMPILVEVHPRLHHWVQGIAAAKDGLWGGRHVVGHDSAHLRVIEPPVEPHAHIEGHELVRGRHVANRLVEERGQFHALGGAIYTFEQHLVWSAHLVSVGPGPRHFTGLLWVDRQALQ